MPRGGSRAKAGRKKGSATKRTAAVKAQAVAEGITPAEVMQKAMEYHFRAKRYDEAAAVAKDLAPYRHPRLSAVEVTGANGGPVQAQVVHTRYEELRQLPPDELIRIHRATLGLPESC